MNTKKNTFQFLVIPSRGRVLTMELSSVCFRLSLIVWVWWLILCVNLTWQRDAQIAGKTLFLDMSVRVILQEISVWLSRLRKVDSPQECLDSLNRTKSQRKRKLAVSSWAGSSIFSCPWTSVLWFSGPQTQAELHLQHSWVSSFQIVGTLSLPVWGVVQLLSCMWLFGPMDCSMPSYIYIYTYTHIWAFLMVQTVKNVPAIQETWVQSLDLEDPLETGKATHSSPLAWRIPAWWATVHGVTNSWTQLSN